MKPASEILKEMPLPAVFTFDSDSHRYELNGKELPSVTQVLREAGLIDEQWYNDFSRDRGSVVHLATEFLDDDQLDEDSVDERIKPYLDAYRQFKIDSGFEPLPIVDQVTGCEVISEAHRFQPKYGYAGTIDRIGMLKSGRKAVIDIKTGAAHATHRLQLAAYQALLDKPGEYARLVVGLKKDGKYSVTEFKLTDYPVDFGVFAACLQVINFRRTYK